MKHLKLTFVGLLAITSAASDAFAFGPPPPPPMGGPPMGGMPMGGMPMGGPPMAGGLPRPPIGGAQAPPMGAAASREMSPGIARHPAPLGMSPQALGEMPPGISRQALREMSPVPEIRLAATPSITMVTGMVADTDTMAADVTVTDAPMRPEPR